MGEKLGNSSSSQGSLGHTLLCACNRRTRIVSLRGTGSVPDCVFDRKDIVQRIPVGNSGD